MKNSRFVLLIVTVGMVCCFHYFRVQIKDAVDWYSWTEVKIPKCQSCNIKTPAILIDAPDVCIYQQNRFSNRYIDLLILVMCPATDSASREVIRETWGSIKEQRRGNFKVLFVVGKMKSSSLVEEAREHRDILQINVPDTYKSITEKVVYSLQWFMKRCSDVPYVLKTNTDVFLNMPNIIQIFGKYNLKNKIIGNCFQKFEKQIKQKRTNMHEYNGEYSKTWYPPHCSTSGYLMRSDTVASLVTVFEDTPFTWTDDVYMGFSAYKARVNVFHVPGFDNVPTEYDIYEYCNCVRSVHVVKPGRHREVWNQQLRYCGDRWAVDDNSNLSCYLDVSDIILPLSIVVVSILLIILSLIGRYKLRENGRLTK